MPSDICQFTLNPFDVNILICCDHHGLVSEVDSKDSRAQHALR